MGKKLREQRKINQSDTDELSGHRFCCWLALQRPPDKNRAKGTLRQESGARISSCSGLLFLTTGEMARDIGPCYQCMLGKTANTDRAPGRYTDLQEGEGWHRANIAESLASSPKLVLPKAQARGGKEKQKAQLGQYYGSTTVQEGGTWFGSSQDNALRHPQLRFWPADRD